MSETQNNIDLEEIRQGFEIFDVNKTGYISPLELLETFDAMNLKKKDPFIYNIIHSLTKSKKYSNQISIDELISFIDTKLNSNSKKGINLIFNSLCEPNNNYLSLSSLPQIARESDDILTEKELRSLIQKAEMGGEDIDLDEFIKILADGKNLEDDNESEEEDISDKENKNDNIKNDNGGIKEEKNETWIKSKYNINSNNSDNSKNSNSISMNSVYRKKASSKATQNNENINKNINNKKAMNENVLNNNKKKNDDKIININKNEEIKKSERSNNKSKNEETIDIKSLNKENKDDDECK